MSFYTKMTTPLTFVSIACAAIMTVFGQASLAADLYKSDAYKNYKPNLKNGETLFNAGACGACHGAADNHELLGGGLKMSSFVGTFYAPNLSNSSQGIGSWTNANFLNALINGVSPTGDHYYPVFPYTKYSGMKPEDALDIMAYIGSLPSSDNSVPEHEVSFPYNLNSTMSFWKRGNFNTPRWAPGSEGQLARGKYLVENVGACGSCHTPRSTTYGLQADKALKGATALTGGYAPAIDASVIAKLASPEIFTEGVLVEGKKLNGQPIVDPVMRKIVKHTASLSKDDRLAMFAYLKGKEVKKKKIDLTVKTCELSTTGNVTSSASNDGSLEADADEFIGKYCRNCHGLGQSSQGSFPAGTLASIAADATFIIPGNPAASRIYESITSDRMPLGAKPNAAEISRLGEWITSLGSADLDGSASKPQSGPPPRTRKIIDRAKFVQMALNDINQQNHLDRPFIRYFSYRSQYNGVYSCESEELYAKRQAIYKAGLNKLLNSVSLGPRLVVPEIIADTHDLLVRIDIRDLGWTEYQWDVLTGIYPYGVDPHSDANLSALTKATHSVLPILRTDWFMANSSRPAIYHALLNLPKHIQELEHRLGVNVEKNIAIADVVRAAFDRGASGVSAHNRLIERHDLPQAGYYWKSYDFAGSFGDQSLRERPHGPDNVHLPLGLKSFDHDGGEMIFSLPNGMQGYYLSDDKGNRIDEGPENIVSYQQRPKDKAPTIVNGRSCFDCHADGILKKRDIMRGHIETTNLFDVEQARLLLKMYVEQAEMDKLYDSDKARFVGALNKIEAAEKGASGNLRSIVAPGNKEVITWYADLYEANLDIEGLAAEFDMEVDEFKKAVLRISDTNVQQLAMQKILQIEGGASVPRFEIEQQFPALQKALTGLNPLTVNLVEKYGKVYGKSKSKVGIVEQVAEVHAEQAYKVGPVKQLLAGSYKKIIPQYLKENYVAGKRLQLSLKTKTTHKKVGDDLTFTVASNKDCELQILYVESDGNVEIFPTQFIGDPWLRANKSKHIPVAGSGDIVFDAPGHSENLIVFCNENGLGTDKLSTKQAKAIASKSKKTASRGIVFNFSKKVEKSKGQSAFHSVTFNVKR